MTFGSSFCKKGHCIHILWCIFMGLGHNDPWVESHICPQQPRGQRSFRGQWHFSHINRYGVKSNITMIAQVYHHESRWDSWFKNCLVWDRLYGCQVSTCYRRNFCQRWKLLNSLWNSHFPCTNDNLTMVLVVILWKMCLNIPLIHIPSSFQGVRVEETMMDFIA